MSLSPGDNQMLDPDGMNHCEWCEGMFVPDDMDGEHCRGCAEELFGPDDVPAEFGDGEAPS